MPLTTLIQMETKLSNVFTLEEGLDLRKLQTTGSVLHINEHLDESDYTSELSVAESKNVDFIGQKVENFAALAENMINIHPEGFVKKKILEEGGGLPLQGPCTVFIAFSGYFENAEAPFDVQSLKKPFEVNLTMTDCEDHGLIPGLDIAIKSMLVGELSVFLFSHEVAYGEYGMPPRIQPKTQCVFYVKLIKCILTPKERKINFSEPNMFGRVEMEVKNFYGAGALLFKSNNFSQAANLFRKAIYMLHKCRLANEAEEKIQEKWLKKLYFNLAVCYNKVKQPLKACIACNELNRLDNLWNNGRALFQNAKALRMIGQYDAAKKRLKKAMKLTANTYQEELKTEMELLLRTEESCNQTKLIGSKISEKHIASDDFKKEVDNLIKNFKENVNLCQLALPTGLNSSEIKYVKEACIRENLFVRSVDPIETESEGEKEKNSITVSDATFAIDKEDDSSSDGKSELSQCELHEKLLHEI